MAKDYSDEQVMNLVKQVKALTDICAENINKRMKNEGVSFLYKVK